MSPQRKSSLASSRISFKHFTDGLHCPVIVGIMEEDWLLDTELSFEDELGSGVDGNADVFTGSILAESC